MELVGQRRGEGGGWGGGRSSRIHLARLAPERLTGCPDASTPRHIPPCPAAAAWRAAWSDPADGAWWTPTPATTVSARRDWQRRAMSFEATQ